jgi:ribonuclease HI
MDIIINTDGGARGNPGPAAAGAVIRKDGEIVATVAQYLGAQTNNWAEYEALILALEEAHGTLGEELAKASVEIRMDSQLIVRQMEGRYKVKEPSLKEKHARVTDLISAYAPHARFVHVPREENGDADKLVNQVLDAR